MIKGCSHCNKEFNTLNKRKVYCSPYCAGAAYHLANKDRRSKAHKAQRRDNPRKSKDSKLKVRYGISIEQYESMAAAQNHKCKICECTQKLHVDHDHKTGKIRGLLCNGCNRSLGFFNDSDQSLLNAFNYLKAHNEN